MPVPGSASLRQDEVMTSDDARPGDPYGYLLVHFVEDPDGFAERIHLDVSAGDDPTSWVPLNGGRPVLASHLGTTGVRDPYLVQDPHGRSYVVATDLRVFHDRPGGVTDAPDDAPDGYVPWYEHRWLSRDLVVWASDDLVEWSEPWLLRVAPPTAGRAWAPEATWVEDYDGRGSSGFALYWSSTVFADDDPDRSGTPTSDTLVAFTADFTQADLDARNPDGPGLMHRAQGEVDAIDASVRTVDGVTYRAIKENGPGARGVVFARTTAREWWRAGTDWQVLQTRIGADEYGEVEAPLFFRHHDGRAWTLMVDQYGERGQGYRAFTTTDPDAAEPWRSLGPSAMSGMVPPTKHGGVLPLTRAAYDAVRAGDVRSATDPEPVGATPGTVPALPPTVAATASDGRTRLTAVTWDPVDPAALRPGAVVEVRGVVAGYAAQRDGVQNDDTWAPDPERPRTLVVTRPVTVTQRIEVSGSAAAG
ncbi:hypothetical protein EBM89_07455 [Cellulomonas triticagri]|uniref:Bacterial Ig-like domain-containing protein n=2 Tax=Cellulomonas triticagri TaxID=2483352 RepID=A0A3M2JRB7_9CELL|nr:hypothetical protein EBM89_07455 [Cellulomonas triticagri]